MGAKSAAGAPISPERAETELAVDEIRRALLQILLDHVRPVSGEAICGDRCIELLLRRVDHRLNETFDGLPCFLGDGRKGLAVAELFTQLIPCQSEIRRCSVQPG